MALLLDNMPISKEPGEVIVRDERIRIRAEQIMVWISLSRKLTEEQNPAIRPFPAILDTGLNHSLAISERHLHEWAGLNLDSLEIGGWIRDRGQRLLLRKANIWVHTNVSGSQERLVDSPPHLLRSRTGIAVYPGSEFPRLPIVGLKVITENELLLTVVGSKRRASLRTVRRWWPFT